VSSRSIKIQIISKLDSDIVAIIETHLCDSDTIEIDNYCCISHNRKKHVRAKKGSGGVSILIKNTLLDLFNFEIVDKSIDGILAIKFISKYYCYHFYVLAVYLPPEQTNWGRDNSIFYSHLIHLMYEFEDGGCDNIIVAGDFNSKIGAMKDFIPDIDVNISDREVLSNDVNNHGHALIDFLHASKMCVCNGRITNCLNNFTFVAPRGASVVDYIITPIANIDHCIEMYVLLVRDLFNQYCEISNSDIDLSRHLPDHSVLKGVFRFNNKALNVQDEINPIIDQRQSVCTDSQTNKNNIYYKRFHFTDPAALNIFTSQLFIGESSVFLNSLDGFEQGNVMQSDMDALYENFCSIYHKEMSRCLRSTNIHPSKKRRPPHKPKPFWTAELTDMWNAASECEARFLKSKGRERQELRRIYYDAQNKFDKEYRKCERLYNREKIVQLESLTTANPQEFWEKIKSLGPNINRGKEIPMEILLANGQSSNHIPDVLEKWRNDYASLFYSSASDPELQDVEELCHNTPYEELNIPINEVEIERVTSCAKRRKAIGFDNLPNEIFKLPGSKQSLAKLLEFIFENEITPSIWKTSIIKPIPKTSLSDPRVPLQYRGISLLSTVYKLFTAIINRRLQSVIEQNNMLVEEQNGFREDRSCLDHLFSLTSIINFRKDKGLNTFGAFVDFEKAFDKINHSLLFRMLQGKGICGKIYTVLTNLYSNCNGRVNINGFLTPPFNIHSGVRQGDSLSTTLFALFINSLAENLNMQGKGISSPNISCLLYADDVVILAETENDLQAQLHVLENWCLSWNMKVNVSKTKIIHFRPKSMPISNFIFTLNNDTLETTSTYKYLGIILDEHLTFEENINILSASGTRALGSIFNKFYQAKGFGYSAYSKLYHSCVTPITDYCSAIWGQKDCAKIETVHNKAIKFFLGVHTFASTAAVTGDMGWLPPLVRRKLDLLRYWNRLVQMDNNRLTKEIFEWHFLNITRSSILSKVCSLLRTLDLEEAFYDKECVSLEYCEERMMDIFTVEWRLKVEQSPKLRTYKQFKCQYGTELYVYKIHDRSQRSILAQLRSGILPLQVEIGRYSNMPLENRKCLLCNNGEIEDEYHFLFNCSFYTNERELFVRNINFNNYEGLPYADKMKYLFSEDCIKIFAKYVQKCFLIRRNVIFR